MKQLLEAARKSRVKGMTPAIQRALKAGVPWMLILQWLIQYGPQLVEIIQDLISRFQAKKK